MFSEWSNSNPQQFVWAWVENKTVQKNFKIENVNILSTIMKITVRKYWNQNNSSNALRLSALEKLKFQFRYGFGDFFKLKKKFEKMKYENKREAANENYQWI